MAALVLDLDANLWPRTHHTMSNTEIRRIQDQLRRVIHGDAWLGRPLHSILDDIEPADAAGRPPGGVNSPWEIVEHIVVWLDIATRRLQGEQVEPTPEEDWPAPIGTGAEDWADLRARLDRAHDALQRALDGTTDAHLQGRVPGRPYDHYVQLHGVIQHTAYHAGQVLVLAKAVRAARG